MKLKPINIHLPLVDKAIIDDETYDYQRILIGKVPVIEIKNLFDEHGERLLEHNIRRYLGLHKNWVNQNIRDCLLDDENRQNFYFYNNGITMVCSQFRHSRLQDKNWKLQIKNAQIINGGQTCLTIRDTLGSLGKLFDEFSFQNTYVLLRLYELMEEDKNLIRNITYATNSQTPINLRELKANDAIQQKLELAIKDLGYKYQRKRDTVNGDSSTISLQMAARSILAIWLCRPQVVRAFREEQFFSQFYAEIFNENLNATQLITAVLILRIVENERKHRINDDNAPRFLPYASHFLAMLTGEILLETLNISLEELDHRYFSQAKTTLDNFRDNLYQSAINKLEGALAKLHSDYQTMSLQRLSAIFRRGDLLEFLGMVQTSVK